jgi:hypothetical protein
MKFIFSLLTLICSTSGFGQSDKRHLLHFDGYYETECYIEKGDDEESQDYLRFYASGKVINVGTDCEGTANELKEWFNINAEQVGTGDYKIKGRKLFFSTKSKTGIIEYKGRIKKNGLIMIKWKSQINRSKGHDKYKFIPIAGMT